MTTHNDHEYASTGLSLQAPLRVKQDDTVKYLKHSASGRTGKFIAQYDQYVERNDQSFTILGIVDPRTYDAHDCGQMFCIQFNDGMQISAWPEEVENALEVSSLVLTEPQDRTVQSTLLLALDADAQSDYETSPLMFSQGHMNEHEGARA
ncbi:hypothetical protein P245_21030 [Comamonas thiooxydans]|uniref:Uncharacterized protein n=1 Tax=Comamonas thiooxydans TaxID=363952 RepID=A0A0E3BC38_9BURK|nr:hypothetical protein [Comamonas thiooxydans]KGG86205.1 hypothetical protein P245_21030 [Comamonas thiooxydans]